jgi:hypothetical protein
MTARVHRGVWLSAEPLDVNEGAVGNTVLVLEIPDQIAQQWEWEQDIGYREFLIPADIVNSCGPPQALTAGDVDDIEQHRLVLFWARERIGPEGLRRTR